MFAGLGNTMISLRIAQRVLGCLVDGEMLRRSLCCTLGRRDPKGSISKQSINKDQTTRQCRKRARSEVS